MAAEAAVPLWGWVRRIATISRRIVVFATFLIYNIESKALVSRDAPAAALACDGVGARYLTSCPYKAPIRPPISIVPLSGALPASHFWARFWAPLTVPGQPGDSQHHLLCLKGGIREEPLR